MLKARNRAQRADLHGGRPYPFMKQHAFEPEHNR